MVSNVRESIINGNYVKFNGKSNCNSMVFPKGHGKANVRIE